MGLVVPQPPYTMFAYENSSITTVQTLGSDPQNLLWTVDHPAGDMADANGNAGGVGPKLLTVTITTNTTDGLQTCSFLPLLIKGGTRPYTITVVPLSLPAVTNVTLDPQFDTYNWLSRITPGQTLLGTAPLLIL
ncbi:hypothetical protein BU17DRAFT_47484 [Hysterangium stoloniferum]|nr:hypothetical protein BU17DRAFT_47484 [Hysterangium stoloniferum]